MSTNGPIPPEFNNLSPANSSTGPMPSPEPVPMRPIIGLPVDSLPYVPIENPPSNKLLTRTLLGGVTLAALCGGMLYLGEQNRSGSDVHAAQAPVQSKLFSPTPSESSQSPSASASESPTAKASPSPTPRKSSPKPTVTKAATPSKTQTPKPSPGPSKTVEASPTVEACRWEMVGNFVTVGECGRNVAYDEADSTEGFALTRGMGFDAQCLQGSRVRIVIANSVDYVDPAYFDAGSLPRC